MNPFIISAYKSPEYFCDRDVETAKLKEAVENGRNVLLYSLRRMGKTGLLKHLFYNLSKTSDYQLIYIDISHTYSIEDFVSLLASAMLEAKKKVWYRKAMEFLSGLRPTIEINPVTGQTEVFFRSADDKINKQNLDSILMFFEKNKQKTIIAIDEFQQISEYKEEGFEAYLRSKIQFLNNVVFIFTGSSRRMILSMFSDHGRPFYGSAQTLYLKEIDRNVYAGFVERMMKKTKYSISKDNIFDCMDWAEGHTWYVQTFFNRLWGKGVKKIDEKLIMEVKKELLEEKSRDLTELQRLIPVIQFNLLSAIAKESGIDKPTSKDFIQKYRLGSASSISSALKVLMNKELVYYDDKKYHVYDVFLKRYLQSA
jgi:AAA+ ATPase superfamily predicted ATPase